jgi:hypothetical protein
MKFCSAHQRKKEAESMRIAQDFPVRPKPLKSIISLTGIGRHWPRRSA